MVLFRERGQEDFVVSKFHQMTAVVCVKDEGRNLQIWVWNSYFILSKLTKFPLLFFITSEKNDLLLILRTASVREVTENLTVTLNAQGLLYGERTLKKDNHPCSNPPIRPCAADRSHSSVKDTWQPAWSLPKGTWRGSIMLWGCRSGRNVKRHPGWKPVPVHSDWSDGSTFSRTMTPSTQPSFQKSDLCECPWAAQPEPRLESDYLLKDMKMAVQRRFPSDPYKQNRPKTGLSSLWHNIQKDLKAVITAKGAWTKY